MKNIFLVTVIFLGAPFIAHSSQSTAPSVEQEFNSLGGNEIFMEKAKLLEPEQKISVVQSRLVDRIKRSEFNFDYSSVLGGDPYVDTGSFGVGYQFHINPRWSLGARYSYYFNELSKEAKNLIYNENSIPAVDYPKQQYLATLNWYPIYGKFNMYDLGIVHFDIYLTGGYGQIELRSGNTPTYTVGAGAGFWLNQHWSTRIEAGYQNYQAKNYKGAEDRNITNLTVMLGYLL